jgi:hypothetical protein
VLRRGLRVSAEHLRNRLAWYPPQPPGSAYTRTGSLGRSWAAKVRDFAGGVEGVVGNTMPYAPRVQDADTQAPVHKATGWRTVQGVAEEEADTVAGHVQEALDQEIEKK